MSSSYTTRNTSVSIFLFVGTMICAIAARRPIAFAVRQGSSRSTSLNTALFHNNGMTKLPAEVVQYSQVPAKGKRFTADKIPKGLLKQHTTKKDTWGVIRVFQGRLEYQINEPSPVRKFELDSSTPGIIEPTVLHQVKALTDDLEFVVEFHRLPNTGPVDEKREGL